MHYVGYAPLAAAVSNAGGLGLVTVLTQPSAEALRNEIQTTKALTTKPFGINLTLLPALQPPNYQEFADVVEDEMKSGQLRVVETAGHFKGLQPFVTQFKHAGAYVIHKCTTVRHAKSAAKMGVDMISMDGFDCAGHPGETDIGNWVLFPKAARELDIPFVASGGCADGSQLAAALAMGAEGMNMGTRWMATVEAPVHPNIKQALVDGDEHSTTLVMRSLKNTERVYKNKTALKVIELEKEYPGDFSKIQPYVRGDNYRASFQDTGNTEDSVWSAGTVMGLIVSVGVGGGWWWVWWLWWVVLFVLMFVLFLYFLMVQDDIPTCEELANTIVADAEAIVRDRLMSCLVEEVEE
jgi:nitronate monooxygenase